MSERQKLVFQNNNGSDYFIVAGNDDRALLREMEKGGYVIAWGLDWEYECWGSGRYFGADEFKSAMKAFLGEGRG